MITDENKLKKAISNADEKYLTKKEMYKDVKAKTLKDVLNI
jgi:hypothetical protein